MGLSSSMIVLKTVCLATTASECATNVIGILAMGEAVGVIFKSDSMDSGFLLRSISGTTEGLTTTNDLRVPIAGDCTSWTWCHAIGGN